MPISRLAWRVAAAFLLVVVVVIGFDFLSTVYGKYRQLDPAAYTMFWTRRGWLWTHLAGGAVTIALGPVQFLTQWLRVHPRLHRWTGRIYLTALLVGCVGAIGLIATSPAPFGIRAAFAATALAWSTTALFGLIAIRGRRMPVHRRWMVRNYLVTLSPITFRALVKVPGLMALAPPPVMIPLLLVSSWLLPLLIAEVVYRIVERNGSRPRPALEQTPLGSA